jgi:hypothetical protein
MLERIFDGRITAGIEKAKSALLGRLFRPKIVLTVNTLRQLSHTYCKCFFIVLWASIKVGEAGDDRIAVNQVIDEANVRLRMMTRPHGLSNGIPFDVKINQ